MGLSRSVLQLPLRVGDWLSDANRQSLKGKQKGCCIPRSKRPEPNGGVGAGGVVLSDKNLEAMNAPTAASTRQVESGSEAELEALSDYLLRRGVRTGTEGCWRRPCCSPLIVRALTSALLPKRMTRSARMKDTLVMMANRCGLSSRPLVRFIPKMAPTKAATLTPSVANAIVISRLRSLFLVDDKSSVTWLLSVARRIRSELATVDREYA